MPQTNQQIEQKIAQIIALQNQKRYNKPVVEHKPFFAQNNDFENQWNNQFFK